MKEFCFVCGKKLGVFSDASYIHPDYPMCPNCTQHDIVEIFWIPSTTDDVEMIANARTRLVEICREKYDLQTSQVIVNLFDEKCAICGVTPDSNDENAGVAHDAGLSGDDADVEKSDFQNSYDDLNNEEIAHRQLKTLKNIEKMLTNFALVFQIYLGLTALGFIIFLISLF